MRENPRSLLQALVSGWKKEWTAILASVLLLRLVYAAIGVWVMDNLGQIPLNETIYGEIQGYLHTGLFSKTFVNPWFRWDTISYMAIALRGYRPDATVAFMPLYPLLIRLASPLFAGNMLLSALAVSTLFCALTLILMYELFIKTYPERVAREAVLSFVLFPTAFFLFAGYTEALFLTWVLAFFLLARERRWLAAGLCAGLATLTRLQGVILSAVLLWMMLLSLVEQPTSTLTGQVRQVLGVCSSFGTSWMSSAKKVTWLAVPIPLLFATGYQAWLKLAGHGTIADALRKYWRLETVPPWTGFLLFLQRLPAAHFNYMDYIDLALFILILLAGLISLRRLDPAYSLYTWLTLAVLLTRGTPPHLLASYSRYFLALFPLFLLPALISNRHVRAAYLVISYCMQILLVSIFLWGSWVA